MPKKAHEEEHENHEAWVIPYADMLTLLMVMFLALYAMGNLDLAKFRKLAEAFNQEINGGSGATVIDAGIMTGEGSAAFEAGPGVLDGGIGSSGAGGNKGTSDGTDGEGNGEGSAAAQASQTWPLSNVIGELTGRDQRAAGQRALAEQVAQEQAAAEERRQIAEVRDEVTSILDEAGLDGQVQVKPSDRGLTLVLTDRVLFPAGSVSLTPEGRELIASFGSVLQSLENTIEVVGHTDSTGTAAENVRLSTARATDVALFMMEQMGIPYSRLRPVGLADTQPIASNDTVEGRNQNRRVEITILTKTAQTAGDSTAADDADGETSGGGAAAGVTPTTVTGRGASALAESPATTAPASRTSEPIITVAPSAPSGSAGTTATTSGSRSSSILQDTPAGQGGTNG